MSDNNKEYKKDTNISNETESEKKLNTVLSDEDLEDASGGAGVNFKKIAQTTLKILTK